MILLYIWLTWAALNLLAMLAAPRLFPDVPCTNGFTIHIPAALADRLTPAELHTIRLHELGHLVHGHPWRNLARAVCFIPRPQAVAYAQECQADDYAAARCDPLVLASALLKLTRGAPADLARVRRLVMSVHPQI